MSFDKLQIKGEYRSAIDSMDSDFYAPILGEAITYDRAVGFFSSSALSYIAIGLIPFIKRGGHIRLVASPVLSEEDINAIKLGYQERNKVIEKSLLKTLSPSGDIEELDRLNFLANLIADGLLDIRIAITENESKYGIYHEKMGIFTDSDKNVIAFSGSMNESRNAMELNYEAIDVFCSWKGTDEEIRTKNKSEVFNSIWEGSEPGVNTIEFPSVSQEILDRYMREKLDYEKLDDQLFIRKKIKDSSATLENTYLPVNPIRLYEYQEEAIDTWVKNGFHGVFDMATGTGKTYTGLGALVALSDRLDGKLAAIICCPYQHLVEQWVEDIRKYNIQPNIAYSTSSQRDWKKRLEDAILDQKIGVARRSFFCLVTTNATFSTKYVQEQIGRIKAPILLLVDEAHNFGAPNLKKLLDNRFEYRLALSATLSRHRDEEGTEFLRDYFGENCIEYSLERAIDEDKLTPYKYYPIVVCLDEDEREGYVKYTSELAKCLINKKGKKVLSDEGKKIALKRAKLVAGAAAKIPTLKKYIEPYQKDNHILVYCGATKLLAESEDFTQVDDDDMRQIDVVTSLLGNQLDMNVSQFTSKEDIYEREILKKEFSEGKTLQALIAIKCLDEGVNIPAIKTAFILASTTNPKEYIQRRGRVLRKYPGKEYAEIYDFITLPREPSEVPSLTADQMSKELPLVKNEIARAEEFAKLALNYASAMDTIRDIREAYDLLDYVLEFKEEFQYE